jgi:hypothetical protein
MLTIGSAARKSVVLYIALTVFLFTVPLDAAVTKTELAGNPLSTYPFFEYVHAINANSAVNVAIDPSRFPAIVGQTCDVYVVNAKKTLGWNANNTLTDVTTGGMQTRTFSAGTIQANTFQVTIPNELSGAAGTGLGVGYDVVLDCNRNGLLDSNDYIDGRNNESGFYIVSDTTAPGPLAVTELTYNLSAAAGATYGIPATHLAENTFFPANIGTMAPGVQLPLVVISHGNGHNYQWYDHIGNHLASYGYIVMSHANNTVPGPFTASTTTLAHTDAFIAEVAAGNIPGGAAMAGHLDASKIVWIGHSRGAEGVAISYDRLFDVTYTPANYIKKNIKLISSMLPTDFNGTDVANPHDANYHLWTASGDADVNGSASCDLCQTYHLHGRAVGHRQSTTVQGAGHGDFHNGGGSVFTGPCPIGPANTHLIELGLFLPLVKRYVEDNIPSIDFLTRQYETFRPIGAPTGSCVVVTNQYYDASVNGTVVLDDYQTQPATGTSSSGGSVTFNVDNLTEGLLDDNNSDFTWTSADPFNGATEASASGGLYTDTSRGVVFDWTGSDRFYEWAVPPGEQNFADNLYLSLRGAQGTQHPNTLAVGGDLTFTVTLRDSSGTTSSINIGAYGGGLEQPYQRSGGWHNEMETIRIRLTDFLNNNSGLNLGSIVAVRLNVGPSSGSAQGRVVIDDLMLSNDRAVYDGADNGDPHIRTLSGENYDFQSAGEFTLLRGDDLEIQARQTPVPSAPPATNPHTGLASCVSVNTALAARVAGRRVTYQPSLTGTANPAGMELRVDGNLVDNAVQSVPLGAGARVARSSSGGIEIDFPDGTAFAAIPGWWTSQNVWYLNVSVLNTPATEGIMGLIPSGNWLPRLPDGSSLGPRPATDAARYDALNRKFANAWRVNKATSLFDYAPGTGPDTFVNKNWPPEGAVSCNIPGRPPVIAIERAVAQRLCAQITNRNDRDNCAFDVALTGEPNFAKTYMQGQRLEQGATRTEIDADKHSSRAGEKVTFVASIKKKKSGERIAPATGAVQFTVDGSKVGEPINVDAFGRATLTTSLTEPGQHRIAAAYVPARNETVFLPSVSLDMQHVVVAASTAWKCEVKVNGNVIRTVNATDRNDCYRQTSFGSENCKRYAAYFRPGDNLLEQYFNGTDRVNSDHCRVCGDLNQTSTTGSPGWRLVSGPGITTPIAPTVVSAFAGWGTVPGASWISVNPSRGSVAGDYVYEYSFCLCATATAPSLSLSFLADNGARVLLNGRQIYATTGDGNFKAPPKTITYSGSASDWVIPGTNTLRIVVHNDSSVTGLSASLKVTAPGGACP